MKPIKVLFVCMGNICRSPTAHGVFQALVDEAGLSDAIQTESAATHGYHIGNPPDPRSQATALENGIDLSTQRSRSLEPDDFLDYDFIIGMDRQNLSNMNEIKPANHTAKVALMLEYSEQYQQVEVPDPYFDTNGFELVFDMVSDACRGLLREIRDEQVV